MKEPVFHDKYGKGFATKKRYAGFEKLVKFASGIEKWIKRNELKPYNSMETADDNTYREQDRVVAKKAEKLGRIESQTPMPREIPEYTGLPLFLGDQLKAEIAKPIASEPSPIEGERLVISLPVKVKINSVTSSRAIIEALRLGGVPQRNVEKFTFGRDKEISRVRDWLSEEKGSLMLTGNYGVGKSHLIEVLTSMALENSWVVARVEIDPDETPFHKPKKIYEHIVNSISYNQDNTILGFNEFIQNIVESENSLAKEKLYEHSYLGGLLNYWNSGDKSQLLEWIRGDGSNPYDLPRLMDFQTASNIYCNIISGLGWAAKNVLGLNGILIFFDEAEGIDPFWYTTYQFEKARNFLKGAVLMSNDDPRLIKDANAPPFSRKLDLIYCGGTSKKYKHSFLWEEKSNVKFIFSFVPEMLEFMEKYRDLCSLFNDMEKIEIETLSHDDLRSVFGKIVNIYSEAYSFSVTQDICQYIPDGNTRKFVKGAVEGLDLMRFNPDKTPDELLVNYD